MTLEALLQTNSQLNTGYGSPDAVVRYAPPTPEEIEQKRKQHEEYERKRLTRELTTLKLTATITLFRESIARSDTSDLAAVWQRAEAATEFLFGRFEGLTAENVDPYQVVQALGRNR